jgi:hypothetical protein
MSKHTPTTIPCPHCGKPVDISLFNAKIGKQGGETTKKRYGSNHLREIGRKGLAKRWGKQPVKK